MLRGEKKRVQCCFVFIFGPNKQNNALYQLGNENTKASFSFGAESHSCPGMSQREQFPFVLVRKKLKAISYQMYVT